MPRSAFLPALLALAPAPAAPQRGTPAPVVIDHVTVIDVASGTGQPDRRVVVTGSRISAVGPAVSVAMPAGATVVDGRGRFLIPGLWDMHAHVAGPASRPQYAFPVFLANGVTGVRDMGFGVDGLLHWRGEIAAGRVVGPRLVGGGVLVDGAPHVYPDEIVLEVTTPAAARRAVDSLVARGVDFIKAYEMLRPEVFAALAQRARERGIPIAGHLPLAVRAEDAVRAGLRSFEHLRNIEVACSSRADSLRAVAVALLDAGKDEPGMPLRARIHATLRPAAYATQDEGPCDALIRLMAEHGTWQTPNLVLGTQGTFRHDTTERMQRWVPYLQDTLRASFVRGPGEAPRGRGGAGDPAEAARRTEWSLGIVKRMHDAGVRLLPGTDFPIPVMVPGAAVHEELALFVRAGLTRAEALRTATLNPATFLGMADSLGTVEAGKLAELVLLDANPLDDIRHLARVRAVWRGGRYLDRATLDTMLAAVGRAAGGRR